MLFATPEAGSVSAPMSRVPPGQQRKRCRNGKEGTEKERTEKVEGTFSGEHTQSTKKVPDTFFVPKYGKVWRGHWGIENNLHWQLDVNFGEDKSSVHQRNAGTNFAAVRRIALSLLKQNPSKESMGRKRKAAALDSDFLEETLVGAHKIGEI